MKNILSFDNFLNESNSISEAETMDSLIDKYGGLFKNSTHKIVLNDKNPTKGSKPGTIKFTAFIESGNFKGKQALYESPCPAVPNSKLEAISWYDNQKWDKELGWKMDLTVDKKLAEIINRFCPLFN